MQWKKKTGKGWKIGKEVLLAVNRNGYSVLKQKLSITIKIGYSLINEKSVKAILEN